MPYPPAVQGFSGLTQVTRLTLEQNPGEQLLLAQTATTATMSLTTQPNAAGMATTGAHLHVVIVGNVGSGTVVIAGTNAAGGNITSQTYHLNAAPLNVQGYVEFETSEAFATVNANGITISTGLRPSQIMVFGAPAGKYLIPCETDAEEKIGRFSPADRRGILWANFRTQQTHKWATLDKLDCAVYPDALWMLYMLVTNNPTITTVPATPTSLLSATTIGSTMTLTTAPTAPGMFLIFTPSGNSATGTITVSGNDIYGNAQSETIAVGANNNVVYSTKRYSALTTPGTNQFATTGMTAGSQLAVTGVYAWTYTGTWDGINNITKSTATLELFDGVQGVVLPYTHLEEGTFEWEKEKAISFSGKGQCQDFLIVGDPNPVSGYPSGVNPFATLTQPTSMPFAGFPVQFWLDALPGGTPFSTQEGSLLKFKIGIMTGLKSYYVGDGMQRWSNLTYGAEPSLSMEADIVYSSYQKAYQYFKPNQKFVLGVQFQGALLGSIGSNTYFETVKFTLPVKIDTFKPDRSKDPVEANIKLLDEYDFGLGYGFIMSMTAQVPPTYTL
jgi:hypothetical protein